MPFSEDHRGRVPHREGVGQRLLGDTGHGEEGSRLAVTERDGARLVEQKRRAVTGRLDGSTATMLQTLTLLTQFTLCARALNGGDDVGGGVGELSTTMRRVESATSR